ncbi:MAG: type IX secretion system membrane protein PorP/SprF [Bacteroidales bacterium]|nr:type IX secretion system membrane protein PorP/SprF [Bacteroidales bacterium]
MKKYLLTLVILTISLKIFGQQDPHYSFFMYNQVSYNPAYSGTEGMVNVVGINRNQWMGLDGAPQTSVMSADMPINIGSIQSGIGVTILNDKIGFENNFSAKLAYAYHIKVGTGLLSIGVDGGMFNKAIEGDWQFPDEAESIFSGKCRKMAFDMSGGLYYNVGELTLGLSSTHLLEPKLDYDKDGKTFLARHYYFTSSYNIPLANSLFDLTPGIILMSDGKSLQADINISCLYNKKIFGGVTYRNEDALSVLAGFSIMNDFKVGVAYEFGISKLRKTNAGSFEVMLGYSFMLEHGKPAQKVRSVRFL